jgi:hypothetical protein
MEKDGLGLWSPALSPEKRRKDGALCIFGINCLPFILLLGADGDLQGAGSVGVQIVNAGGERCVCIRQI